MGCEVARRDDDYWRVKLAGAGGSFRPPTHLVAVDYHASILLMQVRIRDVQRLCQAALNGEQKLAAGPQEGENDPFYAIFYQGIRGRRRSQLYCFSVSSAPWKPVSANVGERAALHS